MRREKTGGHIRTCYACKAGATGKEENYHYTECGLKNITLTGVLVFRCTRCGAAYPEIPNMDGLHRSIALGILCKRSKLNSDEIRFLRGVAGFTATALSKSLGVTKNAVSKWENNGKIGRQSERSIRIICGMAIIEEIVTDPDKFVDDGELKKTLSALKAFLAQFKSQTLMSPIGSEVQESENLLIDPAFPYTSSVLEPHRDGVVIQ